MHHETGKTYGQSTDGAEAIEGARENEEPESGMREKRSPSEVGSGSPEDQYDDLYVFIPGTDPERNSQEPLMCCRPPLPPPRPVSAAFQLEKPHFTLQSKFKVQRKEMLLTGSRSISGVVNLCRKDQLLKPFEAFLPIL